MENTKIVNGSQNELVKYLSFEESAQQLGMSYSALSAWLLQYPQIRDKYCLKGKVNGRLKYVLLVEGLPVIANMKDSDRGNQRKKIVPSTKIPKAKQQLAERAVEQTKMTLTSTSFDVMRQMIDMLEVSSKRMDSFEKRMDKIESPEADVQPLSKKNRKLLWDRVNAIHYATGIPHAVLYADLHLRVGRAGIEQYLQADYYSALRHLKPMFKKNNLYW